MTWTFLDYVDWRGRNRVKEWIAGLDPAAQIEVRAALNAQLRILASKERLDRPDMGLLRGKCRGLLEIILTVDNVEYRPLAYYGPEKRQVTLLHGAIEKGGRLQPKSACEVALRRIQEVKDGIGKAIPHDFS